MYLIDGHNLIGSGQVPGIRLDQEDDEYRLVQWLRARQPKLRQSIVVVFDGGIPGGTSQALSGGGVTAVFAAQMRDRADRVIFERAKDELIGKDVVVVSNDAVLREAAKGLGTETLVVSDFMARVNKPSKRRQAGGPTRLQAEAKLSKAEVEEWLALFEEREDGV
ncbi:MAG: hypothetical protein GY759_18620 [Chloroflexi bacterium]|nr:hypothetical protein [Chloroflexota bacterium]